MRTFELRQSDLRRAVLSLERRGARLTRVKVLGESYDRLELPARLVPGIKTLGMLDLLTRSGYVVTREER